MSQTTKPALRVRRKPNISTELTPSEIEIIATYIASPTDIKKLAESMLRAYRTVQFHLENIRRKLGTNSTAESAAALTLQKGDLIRIKNGKSQFVILDVEIVYAVAKKDGSEPQLINSYDVRPININQANVKGMLEELKKH